MWEREINSCPLSALLSDSAAFKAWPTAFLCCLISVAERDETTGNEKGAFLNYGVTVTYLE
jgi:hypothetical protein